MFDPCRGRGQICEVKKGLAQLSQQHRLTEAFQGRTAGREKRLPMLNGACPDYWWMAVTILDQKNEKV